MVCVGQVPVLCRLGVDPKIIKHRQDKACALPCRFYSDIELYYFQLKRFKQVLVENFAEQGEGRRNPDGFRGRQRSYAEFYTTDVKVFYLIIVL